MPSIEKHVETSLKRTGRGYPEVHQWIDDPEYKNARHDITMIPDNFQLFKDKYGEEAAREYVQHLSDDIKGRFGHVLEAFSQELASAIAYFGSK